MAITTRSTSLALAFTVLVGVALVSIDSSADKSFTMKMEDSERATWEKSFNKLLHQPFATKLSCKQDAKMSIDAGEGCIEVGDKKLCCKSFVINLACDASQWKQTGIAAQSCTDSK